MKKLTFLLFVPTLFLSKPLTAQTCKGDCQNGYGTMVYTDGFIYEGMFFRAQKHGHGIMIYPDGSKIIGSFINNTSTGKVAFYKAMSGQNNATPNAVYEYLYEGDMIGGRWTGWGKLVNFVLGTKYEGAFFNDLPNGFGTFNYKDGSIYTGTLKNGLRDGNGLLKYPDGSVYLGSWQGDLRNGHGTMIDPKSEKQTHGIWLNDVQKSITAIAPSTR